ncbi:hypothetical protein AUM41_19940 [Cronobacter malonaticus]|uniref:Uncharacterized protein n=1 Tax=Cronobacter malonaticus TaxID=413503 RepID=A0A423XQT1_9ENTR|nr:hypothetical protein [Cronobacter malonaticus]EGT4385783.1 hypothetical protein [Cronobacter malonaticus]EGT4423169.1 hypothetical protein [Cronobacter malonaticus]EGT4448053.1 hypothetical protein [Cronobacter malonaticus]EGT4456484.1 hypothetical protein [Cronobacter malonaticus]
MTRKRNTFSKSIKTQRNQPVTLTEIFSGFLVIVPVGAITFRKLITLLRDVSGQIRMCNFIR